MPSLTSNKNKKRLPANIAPVTGRCVPLYLPEDQDYLGLLLGAIYDLSLQIRYDRDPTHKAKDVAAWWRAYWRDLITRIEAGEDCNPEICEGSACEEFQPNVGWITYAPNDPFQTPDYLPPGYIVPPWYNNPTIPLPGVLPGDAMVNFASLPIFADLPELLAAGLPRFRVNFQGSGEVEIELIRIPQGGLAYITVDGDPLTGQIVDLDQFDVGDIASLETIFKLVLDGAQIVQTEVLEIKVATAGSHFIDISFLPNIGSDVVVGFGGGLRRVSLCGSATPAEVNVPQFQLNGCNLEWRPNAAHAWVVLGDVCGEDADLRVADCGLEQLIDGVWTDIPDSQFVPLDGSCTMTGGLEIFPVSNEVNLTVKPHVTQNLNVAEIYGADQNVKTRFAANGDILNSATIWVNTLRALTNNWGYISLGSNSDTGFHVLIYKTTQPGRVPLMVSGNVGQTADLQRWAVDVTDIRASINASGAARFRNEIKIRGLSSTSTARDMAILYTVYADNIDAQRRAKVVLAPYYWLGQQDAIAAEADPAGVKLKFYDALNPVPKQAVTGERQANAALASLIDALVAVGLIEDQTTEGDPPYTQEDFDAEKCRVAFGVGERLVNIHLMDYFIWLTVNAGSLDYLDPDTYDPLMDAYGLEFNDYTAARSWSIEWTFNWSDYGTYGTFADLVTSMLSFLAANIETIQCEFLQHMSGTYLSQSAIDAIVDDLENRGASEPRWFLVAGLIEYTSASAWAELVNLAAAYGGEQNCAICAPYVPVPVEWCKDMNFASGQQGWIIGDFGGRTPATTGVYTGLGFEAVLRTIVGVGLQYANEVYIIRSFEASEISRVLLTYDFVLGEFEINFDGFIRLTLGGSHVASIVIPGSGNTTGTNKVADMVLGSPVIADKIEIYAISSHYNDGTDSGSVLLKSVQVEGESSSPFGVSNC